MWQYVGLEIAYIEMQNMCNKNFTMKIIVIIYIDMKIYVRNK